MLPVALKGGCEVSVVFSIVKKDGCGLFGFTVAAIHMAMWIALPVFCSTTLVQTEIAQQSVNGLP